MNHSGVPTSVEDRRKATPGRVAIARRPGTPRGQRPRARSESPRMGTGRSRVRLAAGYAQTASGSRKAHADDGRAREVGPLRSTEEAAEQGWATSGGGDGGKGAGQGELARSRHAPDTEPGGRAQCARAGTYRPREEDRKERFTTLLHHVYDLGRLHAAYFALKRNAAAGSRRRDVAALRREPGGQTSRISPRG